MIRQALVLGLVATTGCLENHAGNPQVIEKTDCYTCHAADYEATGPATKVGYPSAPAHLDMMTRAEVCPKDCVQCHTTDDWHNALGGCRHPEAMQTWPDGTTSTGFVLTVPSNPPTKHGGIKCLDCHNQALTTPTTTSHLGKNTDCISCHPNDSAQKTNHTGITSVGGVTYAYSTTNHGFCLDCHPQGLAATHDPAKDPMILPHHGATCAQCHDYASGIGHRDTQGLDVSCVNSSCHNGLDHDCPPGSGLHGPAPTGGAPSCTASGCHPNGKKPSHGC